MKTAIKVLKGFLIDRLETIVNELFHYNNFLVDQLEKVVNQFISFYCVTITKNNPRKQVSSRFLIYQLEKVLIDYIYIPLDADSTTLFLTRTTAHFPRGSIGKCFRKATNVSSILTETTISQQWDTNWKFLESGQSFSALRNFDRQRAPPLWRKLLRDIGSRRRFIWLQVKKKNFHARVSIPLPSIPQFFPLFDEESATFQLVNRLPLTFH